MDRNRVAEFVLLSVLPADRAAAVTGDFVEEAETRGSFWFWSSVVRTAVSRVVHDFREQPIQLLLVGGIGYLKNFLFPLFVFGGLLTAIFVLAHSPGHQMGQPLMVDVGPPPGDWEPIWPIRWTINILWPVWIFLGGRWAAKRAPGREVAAAVVVAGFGWISVLIFAFVLSRSPWRHIAPGTYPLCAWHDVVLIAGAVWMKFYGALKSGGRKPAAQS